MINVYVIQTDTAGCYYQRLKLPLEALVANYPDEFAVHWNQPPQPGTPDNRSVVLGQRIMGHGTHGDPGWRNFCTDPRFLTVYEIDDDILDLDPANHVPYSIFTPNRLGTMENMHAAGWIVASTPNLTEKIFETLAAWHGSPPVTTAPNCVADGSVIQRPPRDPDAPITIGWAGSMFHAQDFPPDLVQQLYAVACANPHVKWVSIGANYLGWGSTFGWSTVEAYHSRLPLLDIGIAPLTRTPFNNNKSWIKGLDYMAHGVVPVVEAWGQYPDLFDTNPFEGYLGLIREEAMSWFAYLDKAIVDLRMGLLDHAAMAARAREFEISKQVHIWADVFRKATR